ncbi:MAG: hypothetical protein K2X60_03300 [Xanthobacteraceae bacterium]|nr:hypothetical protein [Xanthobacteraceae bacterium]
MQRVLEIMKGREFHDAVANLPAYVAANAGAVSAVKEFLKSVAMPADGISKIKDGRKAAVQS